MKSSPTTDLQKTQARTFIVALSIVIIISVMVYLLAGSSRYTIGYVVLFIGGLPVIGITLSALMIYLQKWRVLASFYFVTVCFIVAFGHYLAWAIFAPKV